MARGVAVVIGVDEYLKASRHEPLQYAVKDARRVAAVLRNRDIFNDVCEFDARDILCLTNPKVNRIRRAVEKTFRSADSDTVVFFYFAGHGELDDAYGLHLLAADSRADLLQSTSISVDFLGRVMRESRSKRQVLILDSCFSGAVGRGLLASPRSSLRPLAKLGDLEGSGRYILASATPTQNAYEPNGDGPLFANEELAYIKQGIFTYYLLTGLETGHADLNEDGYISVDELFTYMRDQVDQATNGRQTPMSWGLDAKGTLRLAKSQRVPAPTIGLLRVSPRVQEARILELGNRGAAQTAAEIDAHTDELLNILETERSAALKRAAIQALCALHGGATPSVHTVLTRLAAEDDQTLAEIAQAALGILKANMIYIPVGSCFVDGTRLSCDAFYIDRNLVTNERFYPFAITRSIQGGWQADGLLPDLAIYPVTSVAYRDAQAFAAWARLRLPTETEWIRAAYAESERRFPWGDTFDPTLCNTAESGCGDTTPVGQFPGGASPFGVLDLVGNVWEWLDTGNGRSKVVRGGSWKRGQAQASRQHRPTTNILFSADDLGFRCVRDPYVPLLQSLAR